MTTSSRFYTVKYLVCGRWRTLRDIGNWPNPKLYAYASWAKRDATHRQPEATKIKVLPVRLVPA